MGNVSYSKLMESSNAYLSVRLDLDQPVEISDFAALFAGMGGQFESFLKSEHPEMSGSVRMYVKEVRQGSIVADLFTQIPDLIGYMDDVLIVSGFASLFSKRVRNWVSGVFVDDATKTDLKDANETLRAIANAQSGTASLTSYKYESGIWTEKVEATFTVHEAKEAIKTIEAQKRDLDQIEASDHQRVLMVFTRPDSGDVQVGKNTGERVVIERLDSRKLPLVYASELAEQEIKHELRDVDQNIFKRGFVVDVNVSHRNGKPIAYSVTNLHQVIDLPDDLNTDVS